MDILDYKRKFILLPELKAIVGDYVYYSDHEKEIDSWLEEHDCSREGMVITFKDTQTRLMFIIKWI